MASSSRICYIRMVLSILIDIINYSHMRYLQFRHFHLSRYAGHLWCIGIKKQCWWPAMQHDISLVVERRLSFLRRRTPIKAVGRRFHLKKLIMTIFMQFCKSACISVCSHPQIAYSDPHFIAIPQTLHAITNTYLWYISSLV